MGSVPGGKALQDGIASVSPWLTLVHIDNQTNQPVLVYLARNPEEPHPEDSLEHTIPPNDTYGLPSGWLREPKATLLIRTGVEEAKILRVPNNSKLQIRLAPHGLRVDFTDPEIEMDSYEPAQVVPGHDTVPMVFRGESFHVDSSTGPSVAQQALIEEEPGPLSPAKEVPMEEAPLSPSMPPPPAAPAFQEPCSPSVAPPVVPKEPSSPSQQEESAGTTPEVAAQEPSSV
mmetsp:Transcript_18486/g.34646  ORF Transcript_18486/g.34646 Transcript_18486/m.34646 type:complete len:230 (+) Transcript_18486:75-764(+)